MKILIRPFDDQGKKFIAASPEGFIVGLPEKKKAIKGAFWKPELTAWLIPYEKEVWLVFKQQFKGFSIVQATVDALRLETQELNPTIELGQGSSINVFLTSSFGASNQVAVWNASGSMQLNGTNPEDQMNYLAPNTGAGTFSASTSNTCGSSQTYVGYVNVTSGPPVNDRVQNTPSPATSSFFCVIPEEYSDVEKPCTLQIFSS